ncbi:MAG: PfkB family carbohydrate kinase [bacterium]|jgi:sulfofructose kinase|nr:PfkB family carbohydrate kinase [bacterium]
MRLIALGHIVLDHLLLVDHYPAMDSKVTARRGRTCTGGPAARAAITAAALGAEVHFAGCVGDDEAGQRIRRDFEAAGVDLDGLQVCAGQATPRASIWVEARHGKRTVVLDRGGLPDYPATLLERLPWGEGCLLLDGKEPIAREAARRARAGGMTVLLDLGGPREEIAPLVAAADVVAVSKAFVMSRHPGLDLLKAAAQLAEAGPRLAIITMGAGGAIVCERGGEPGWVPAWSPGTVVDTTGAGDAYHGTLAWALLKRYPLRQALACAAVAGGLACRDLGGEISGLDAELLLREAEAVAEQFGG